MARCLNHLGELLSAQHHPDKALLLYQRAFAIREKALGPNNPGLASDLLGMGRAWLARHEPARAVPVLESAVRLREPDPSGSAELAQARFALAQALWESGGDRARGLALAAQAHDGLAGAGPRYQEELRRLDQWQTQQAKGRVSAVRPAKGQ
jgi:tetratricopeptide (TPR) repeat protein